jgi:hypothetical protein
MYQVVPFLESFGVDVSFDNILFNDINQASLLLAPSGIPWCGP